MTGDELDELLRDCPVLYHMADRGSWASIRRHGLLSTSALLDLFEVTGSRREAIEARRRPEGAVLEHARHGRAVVRDQKPMDDPSLLRCLEDGLVPEDWYRLLNGRVFLWLTPGRLHRLLSARSYCGMAHDVLELDAARLVAVYRERITLSPINSGATRPFPRRRGVGTFLPIGEYPYATWSGRRKAGERVVELAVAHGIPDVEQFVCRVLTMKGADVVDIQWASNPPRRCGSGRDLAGAGSSRN